MVTTASLQTWTTFASSWPRSARLCFRSETFHSSTQKLPPRQTRKISTCPSLTCLAWEIPLLIHVCLTFLISAVQTRWCRRRQGDVHARVQVKEDQPVKAQEVFFLIPNWKTIPDPDRRQQSKHWEGAGHARYDYRGDTERVHVPVARRGIP
jgi:hypothetical protein